MNSVTPTDEQRAVIEYKGNLVVIARPGSGKTLVLSEKIREILPLLPPYKGVIAISYTNKASDELKRRSSKNGIDVKSSFFGTVDKFCDREIIVPFLRHLWGKADADLQIRRIRDLPQEERERFKDVEGRQVPVDELVKHFGLLKDYYKRGTVFLELNGALSLYVIRNSSACQRYLSARYSHVFVDEYQDSGVEQHELFLKLQRIGLTAMAVGDADQSIFGFSGKSAKHLIDLSRRDDFKLFPVSYNHRCHPSIINYSLMLLNSNAELLRIDSVRVFEKTCTGDQRSVAEWIDDIIEDAKRDYEVESNSEVGILTRSGKTAQMIDQNLSASHRYFSSTELEEHFSLWAGLFCQLLNYRYDTRLTAEEIIEGSAITLSRADIRKARDVIKQVREVDTDLPNLFESIARILLPDAHSPEAVDLLSETIDDPDLLRSFQPANEDEIQIMTIHKAKGLEFDIVFHLDLYEWVLPAKGPGPRNDWNNPQYGNLEQDVNLHYVGLTRARKACFLCTSTKRINSQGDHKEGRPSEFLFLDGLDKLRTKFT